MVPVGRDNHAPYVPGHLESYPHAQEGLGGWRRGAEALIHSYLNIRPRAQAENTEKSHTESKICGTTTNA